MTTIYCPTCDSVISHAFNSVDGAYQCDHCGNLNPRLNQTEAILGFLSWMASIGHELLTADGAERAVEAFREANHLPKATTQWNNRWNAAKECDCDACDC